MKPESKAHNFFKEGLKRHGAFNNALKLVRREGIDAAFFFLAARECVEHGQWLNFLDLYKEKVSARTVQFYCQLGENAIEWVRAEKPSLKTLSEIQAAAREMILQSPKPIVALCRELGHMRKFGEYDAVKYAVKKRLGNGAQIEFDFEKLLGPIDSLARLGDDNVIMKFPDGKDENEALCELETKLDAALSRVRSMREHLKEPLIET